VFLFVLGFVCVLGIGSAQAEFRAAYGAITKIDDGKSITFTTELGDTVTSQVDPKRTEIYRADHKIDAKNLKIGDKIWITFRPSKSNRAALIKTDPNLQKEIEVLKDKLARAIRILNMEGLVAFSGHISARIPGANTFFIHPSETPRSDVKPSDMCEVNLEGKQLSGPSYVPSETDIHSAIYRSRKDVNAVIHIHPHYVIIPSLVGKDLIAISGHGAIFGAKLPVFPNQDKISTREEADKMAKTLGSGRAVVMRGHGAAVAEGTVEAVLTAAMYLEENSKLLVDAMAVGTPIPMTAEEIKEAADDTYQPSSVIKAWDYYIEKGQKAGIFWDK
jgi:ribulose-5-phosphate 4-epimerase/fuculose-1-phosphate aldolase